MSAIPAITFPIFALIGLGYGIVRVGLFKRADMQVLGQYVLNVALPALLFNAVAKRQITEVLNPTYMLVFLLGGLATLGLIYLWFTIQKSTPPRRAIATMGAVCPNSGFVGYPVILLLLPDQAAIVLALNMLVENFVLIPICLALLELSRPAGHRSWIVMLRDTVFNVLRRPMVIGLILGAVSTMVGVTVPAPLTRVLDMLAASASALALVVIGGTLVGLPIRGHLEDALQIIVGKLILHPIMTLIAVSALPMLGMGMLPDDLRMAVVLSTAMPMFGIYTLLAQEYGQEEVASVAMLGATAGAFFTLSLLLTII